MAKDNAIYSNNLNDKMNKKVINAKKIGENPQQNGFSSSFSKTSL
jgi:hypothetical protein